MANLSLGKERSAPVVAMPVLGINGGEQGHRRGEVVNELVESLQRDVREIGVDVALVTPDASVFSAVQHLRRSMDPDRWQLEADDRKAAAELGKMAQQGHLALFLGAGVSMSAGLPGWGELLKKLAERASITTEDFESLDDSPLDQAELISQTLGEAELGLAVAEITDGATQYSLAHALLAGLDCHEVITTNYDTLYERAVESTGRRPPGQIPREPVEAGRPWILKMHGDVAHRESIVLTRRSFVRYDANTRPAGSLLQALMMTKHLLVVGTSMSDDNVIRLAIEVDDFLDKAAMFGTFVDVSRPSARPRLWNKRFRWINCRGEDTGERVRQMEIFLDAVAMYAASDASWVLDERFAGLLWPDEATQARAARVVYQRTVAAGGELLGPLEEALSGLGAGTSG